MEILSRTIKEEIAKCEVRCANCHRRKTAREQGHWKYVLKNIDQGNVREW